MNREFDVVIVGAGVTGAVMASLLVTCKLVAAARVALLAEQVPQHVAPAPLGSAAWDLRVFALSRASQRILMACGAWQRMPQERLHPYERMHVWDAVGTARGPNTLSFDCAAIGEANLGYIVDGGCLQTQCSSNAAALGVTVLDGRLEAASSNERGYRLSLADGRELQCGLLIGADGVQSRTRELLGIDSAGHGYSQDALVAHVRTEQDHESAAWQRFLPSGPLAFLPLPDGRSSIVWSTTKREAERLRRMAPAEFASALTSASGNVLGACELTTTVSSFPLRLQYALQYARPRAVLLGDAAHVVHPLAGQGLNLGLLDCACLADVMGAVPATEFGDYRVLRRYERWRRSENLVAAAALDALERFFSVSNPAVSWVRNAGLGVVSRTPLVKYELARRALGLSGDLPALAKA